MLLLSFVENAFKHGKKRVTNPGIIIRIDANDRRLNFIVSNYIIETETPEKIDHTGIGLKNIRRRLQLLFPSSHDLTITARDGRYTVNLNIYVKI
jgi:sensor histidine kinase YesM